MSTFKQCPLRWKFKYIDGRKEPSGYPAVFGSFVHLVLEEFYKLDNFERDEKHMKELATKVWEEYSTSDEFVDVVGEDAAVLLDFKQKAWVSLSSIWDVEEPKKVEVMETEAAFDIEVGDAQVVGFIDRVDSVGSNYQIIDYKSGAAPMKRYERDKLMQLYVYGLAMNHKLGFTPKIGKLVFLNSRVITENLTDAKVAVAEKMITDTAVKIRVGKEEGFQPQTGPLCGWCSFIEECPEGTKAMVERFKEGRLKKTAPAYEYIKRVRNAS